MEEISVITAVLHPLRRRILYYLRLHGASQVTVLARGLDAQVGSISHHLRMMERAAVVERADAPDGDGRASWWTLSREKLSWSSADFDDSPADALLAREAERQNIRGQIERLQRYRRRPDDEIAEYQAFSTDTIGWATPDELRDLQARVTRTLDEWRDAVDTGDGRHREPVFFFAHGFPTEI
ncbi:ArsR family transcriptional regulator [Microbacterium pseudoresistens]|uniref:DNA-binding transcriptional ArsR family regulator n=1 Tax=Microbacterium pseudoresistens TaxID=640634 RepID=A0A7Y9EWF3_9MICO|nr:DNA-binding transcriptional ArsR family regulator [Microbacterium pseudoresistens]